MNKSKSTVLVAIVSIALAVFMFGCATGADVNLVEGPNLLENHDFSEGQGPWSPWVEAAWGGEGRVVWEDDMVRLEVDSAGEAPWAVAMHYKEILIEQGERYVFRFRARADEPRLLRTNIGNGLSPADPPYLGYQEVKLTDEWQVFEFEFDMIFRTNRFGRIDFNAAYNEGQFLEDDDPWKGQRAIDASEHTVYIDWVELRKFVPEEPAE